jgi:hypothetical protein
LSPTWKRFGPSMTMSQVRFLRNQLRQWFLPKASKCKLYIFRSVIFSSDEWRLLNSCRCNKYYPLYLVLPVMLFF